MDVGRIITYGMCGVIFFGMVSGARAEESKLWKNELAVTYSQATGNTQNSKFGGSYDGIRKTENDELTLKASTLYSSQRKKMDGQKYNAVARYAPNLGGSQWYGFAKAETDHDRFAAIDYRVIPSVGCGYYFSDTAEWKAQAEAGFGYEYVKYTDGSDDENLSLIPRVYLEKAVFEKARLSEELIYYPSLERASVYRFRSETKFTNPLSETLAMRLSFIDEFNSTPRGDAKKNDTQLLASLVYSF
ncbi:MAG: DUF481 domain-containing protein [Candidatus Omnitrophica bacterium]|nr:DUF481 domain-containing protein [Candidatus Omnitrophota bacterium]